MAVVVTIHDKEANVLRQMYSVDAREFCRVDPKNRVPVDEATAAKLRAKPQNLAQQDPAAATGAVEQSNAPGEPGRGGDLSSPNPDAPQPAPAPSPERPAPPDALPEQPVAEPVAEPEPAPVADALSPAPAEPQPGEDHLS